MRSSGRERKKPEIYTVTTFRTKESFQLLHKTIEESDDDADEDEADNDNIFEKSRPKKFSRREKKSTEKMRNDQDQSNSLYGQIVLKKKNASTCVEIFLSKYAEDAVAAMALLINFVLSAGGAKRDWISPDTDLEPLEDDELHEMLSDMIKSLSNTENSQIYPLVAKQSAFRTKYVGFWEKLGCELVSSSEVKKGRQAVDETALTIGLVLIQKRVSLRGELETAERQLNAEHQQQQRRASGQQSQQLSQSSEGGHSARYLAIKEQRTRLSEEIAEVAELITMISNSVVMHRYKDISPVVRGLCMRRLADWMLADPVDMITSDWLKYLGWLSFDQALPVRQAVLQALQALVKEEHAAKLSLFVEKFCGRFIAIAASDSDEGVALHMLRVLRQMMSIGLFDDIDSEQLDKVDGIVFDAYASATARREALLFLMEHTEGFEDVTEADATEAAVTEAAAVAAAAEAAGGAAAAGGGTSKAGSRKAKSQTKGAKKSAVPVDDVQALEARRRSAMQLETLADFAIQHLPNIGAEVVIEMLAQTSLQIENFGAMRDWGALIALLVRDGDDLVANTLNKTQINLLLGMLVAAAKIFSEAFAGIYSDGVVLIRQTETTSLLNKPDAPFVQHQGAGYTLVKHGKGGAAGGGGGGGGGGDVSGMLSGGGTFTLRYDDWLALQAHLQRDLPLLLTRFRDDADSLALLCKILPCFDPSACGVVLKEFRACLKALAAIFDLRPSSDVLGSISAMYSNFLRQGGSLGTEAGNAVQALLGNLWAGLELAKKSIEDYLCEGGDSGRDAGDDTEAGDSSGSQRTAGKTQSKSRRQKFHAKKPPINEETVNDAVFATAANVALLAEMWKYVDCRKYTDMSVEEIADLMAALSSAIIAAWDKLAVVAREEGSSLAGTPLERACANAARDAAGVIYSTVLWATKDTFMFAAAAATAQAAKLQANKSRASGAVGKKKRRKIEKSKDMDDDGNQKENTDGEDDLSDNEKDAAEHCAEEGNYGNHDDDEEEVISRAISLREKLIGQLVPWMTRELSAEGEEEELQAASAAAGEHAAIVHVAFTRQLQRDAFRIISDLRALHVQRMASFKVLHKLAYAPTPEVLGCLKRIFEYEGNCIKEALRCLSEEDQGDEANAQHRRVYTQQLVRSLLSPLSSSIMFDIQFLNRRQAAAVVVNILHPQSEVQEVIRAFIKTLKSLSVSRFLEVQIVALKSTFTERVLVPLSKRREVDEAEEEDFDFDIEANLQTVSDGYEVVNTLVQRLSLFLGVGNKLKGDGLESLVQFFRAGIDFLLSTDLTLGFVKALQPYLKFLPGQEAEALAEYLEEKLSLDPPLLELLDAGTDESLEIKALILFRSTLKGEARGRAAAAKRQTSKAAKAQVGRRGGGGQQHMQQAQPTSRDSTARSARGRAASALEVVHEEAEGEGDGGSGGEGGSDHGGERELDEEEEYVETSVEPTGAKGKQQQKQQKQEKQEKMKPPKQQQQRQNKTSIQPAAAPSPLRKSSRRVAATKSDGFYVEKDEGEEDDDGDVGGDGGGDNESGNSAAEDDSEDDVAAVDETKDDDAQGSRALRRHLQQNALPQAPQKGPPQQPQDQQEVRLKPSTQAPAQRAPHQAVTVVCAPPPGNISLGLMLEDFDDGDDDDEHKGDSESDLNDNAADDERDDGNAGLNGAEEEDKEEVEEEDFVPSAKKRKFKISR